MSRLPKLTGRTKTFRKGERWSNSSKNQSTKKDCKAIQKAYTCHVQKKDFLAFFRGCAFLFQSVDRRTVSNRRALEQQCHRRQDQCQNTGYTECSWEQEKALAHQILLPVSKTSQSEREGGFWKPLKPSLFRFWLFPVNDSLNQITSGFLVKQGRVGGEDMATTDILQAQVRDARKMVFRLEEVSEGTDMTCTKF